MKNPRLRVRCSLLLLLYCSLGTYGIDNVTVPTGQNSTQFSRQGESEIILSRDEEVLEKVRITERLIKSTASKAVNSVLPSLLFLQEKISITPRCASSLMKVIVGIKGMKIWAYQMFDASGKIPNGILSGYLQSFGDYDGCLSVDVPGSNPFRGKYCSIFIRPPLPERVPFRDSDTVLPLFVNFTTKKAMLVDYLLTNAHHAHYVAIRTSVCVPSTCSQHDVEKIAQAVIDMIELPWYASVPSCDVQEPLLFSTGEIIIMFVLCLIGLLAFVATAIDVYLNVFNKENRQKVMTSSTPLKCLMCFSTYTNTLRILEDDNSPHSIKVFHGVKVISMLWSVLFHTYFFTNFNVAGSLLNWRDFGKQFAFQVISNAYLGIDTFFFMSAVLLAYGRMKFSGKCISIPSEICRRVWRLTPPHMLFIATAMLVPLMGSGPAWNETVVTPVDQCRTRWWRNLIFINNFFDHKDTCFYWLWYIAADTQLYILALFVMAPIKSRPRLSLGLNVSIFLIGIVTTAVFHAYYNQIPTIVGTFSHPDDYYYYLDYSQLRSYTHISVTCTGLCVGYILAEKPKLKIPRVLNVLGWLFFFGLGIAPIYGVHYWNKEDIRETASSVLYACASKIAWSLSLSYVTIACFTGHGGVITSILSWSAFVPLSRLTYVAYLIHPLLQFMSVGGMRVPLPLDHRTNVNRYITNVVISYSFAYLISLLFECPFVRLERVMFPKRATVKSTVRSKPEEPAKLETQIKGVETLFSSTNNKGIDAGKTV